ncbi:MAG: hypothetical protein E4H14_02400 [Candidatus Thorarchaeota archaeon]|nr:MAG: hypothetical protein E4H14_02400 [Candidatus Thorarchaeota archaeon]
MTSTRTTRKSDAVTPAEVQQITEDLQRYDAELEQAEARITLRGKSLAEAQKEQTAWPIYYALRRAELSIMSKRMDARVSAIRGRLHRWYKENDALNSSERQLDKYVDSHDEFLTAVELQLYVDEVYKKYNEILEYGFDKRGFALRDFTQARIHEIHNEIL